MIKLTHQQLTILSSANTQPGGFATRPTELKPGAAAKIAAKLIEQGLLRELRAKDDAPIWREDEHGKRFSLKILKAGRSAVQAMAPQSAEDEGPARRGEVAQAGPAAKNGTSVREPASFEQGKFSSDRGVKNKGRTKRALILSLMARDGGATLHDLIAATGWLPHTTRAALTGLRKGGFSIERQSDTAGGASVYRIAPTMIAAAS